MESDVTRNQKIAQQHVKQKSKMGHEHKTSALHQKALKRKITMLQDDLKNVRRSEAWLKEDMAGVRHEIKEIKRASVLKGKRAVEVVVYTVTIL